jgi:hypothetical protein
MDFDKETLYNFISLKYNLIDCDKESFKTLLDKYKTDTKNRELYNSVFLTLFGLTLGSLTNLSLDYEFKNKGSDINETMKELKTTINSLTEKIDLLLEENSDLRENYWRLNQSILKPFSNKG